MKKLTKKEGIQIPSSKDNRFSFRCTRLYGLFVLMAAAMIYPLQAAALSGADKTGSIRGIYGIVFLASLVVLWAFLRRAGELSGWYLCLGFLVCIANGGYLMLSGAKTLEFAMFANSVAYFGSALLPLAMLMIIMDACRITCRRAVRLMLVAVSAGAFLLAASGTKFGLYYKDVALLQANGATVLEKVYGPLHILYAVYLAAYFLLMLSVIIYARRKGLLEEPRYTGFLLGCVFCNIVVWLMGQLVHFELEFLSISYIIAELFLLGVHSLFSSFNKQILTLQNAVQKTEQTNTVPTEVEELLASFRSRAENLTATERNILHLYLQGHEVSEVAQLSYISINTVRRHNANIYAKMQVSSKDELVLYLDLFRRFGRLGEILPEPEPYDGRTQQSNT